MSASMKRLRAQVFLRAEDACENCGHFIDWATGRLDHYFGRGAGRNGCTVETCWALCRDCDAGKTLSQPSAAFWLVSFAAHCEKYSYAAEQKRALDRLAFVNARKGVAA